MTLAVVLVHYHTPELAAEAVAALEQDLGRSGLTAEWVLVDNGSEASERGILERLPVRVLRSGQNLGYAGGANLGVRETTGELVLLMNPDVVVLPGCVQALCSALEDGAAAAGPRFFWDRERLFLLPPTEKRTRYDELLRVLGERGEPWAGIGRRRWRRHARRSWGAREPYRCHELSGALLAFRRQVWQSLGGFDDGYRLYFEETDWLEKLRAHRLEARFVPQAEAVHLFAQSSVGEPRSGDWFTESHRRFRQRFYGARFAAFLELLDRLRRPAGPRQDGKARSGRPAWLEVSSSPQGYPAAARRLGGQAREPFALPEGLRRRIPSGICYLRTVDETGRELGLRTFRTASEPPPRDPRP